MGVDVIDSDTQTHVSSFFVLIKRMRLPGEQIKKNKTKTGTGTESEIT